MLSIPSEKGTYAIYVHLPRSKTITIGKLGRFNFSLGGYIYVDGGVRGIIIYHESVNSYKAYDRNCTFQPTDPCATVEMHSSGFYIEDTCCSSNFDLNGFPTGGPALFPLKEYNVSISGDILFVYN